MRNLTDHQLLIAIAEVNAEFTADEPGPHLEERSRHLNAEGAARWGDAAMDELAAVVTRLRMTSDEFVAWARVEGAAWLAAQR